MDASRVVNELTGKYPNRNIVQLPPQNPSEIICEVDPAAEHPEYSIAIAVIDRSEPHYHLRSKETYEVLIGSIVLKEAGRKISLSEGETYVINPQVAHSVEADSAWVKVTSRPGWTADDHIHL